MATIDYENAFSIKFTKLGLEDLFWGESSQTVERFGETLTVTDINAGNMPFDESATLQEVLLTKYPKVEIVSDGMGNVEIVAANMDLITSIATDVETWRQMTATAVLGVTTSANYNSSTNAIDFVIEQGPKGDTGAQGIDGLQGQQGTTIVLKGEATIAEVDALTPDFSDAWSMLDAGTLSDGTVVAIGDIVTWSELDGWVNIGAASGPQGPQGIQGNQGNQGIQGSYLDEE